MDVVEEAVDRLRRYYWIQDMEHIDNILPPVGQPIEIRRPAGRMPDSENGHGDSGGDMDIDLQEL